MNLILVWNNLIRIDEDIININNGKMTKGVKNVIHDSLEFTRGILKTKRHNILFVAPQFLTHKI